MKNGRSLFHLRSTSSLRSLDVFGQLFVNVSCIIQVASKPQSGLSNVVFNSRDEVEEYERTFHEQVFQPVLSQFEDKKVPGIFSSFCTSHKSPL